MNTAAKYILSNGVILDGTENMMPVRGKAIVVEDGIIRALEDENVCLEKYPGYCRIDLGGKTIMPGLINLHVHLADPGKPAKKSSRKKPPNYALLFRLISTFSLIRAYFLRLVGTCARTQLLSGTTTIRTVGGIMNFDSIIRDDIKAGKRIGPRILCANTAVSVPGGHFAGSLATEATTVEEAAEHVRQIHATSPDLIKLMITGGVMDCEVVGEPGILKMPPELVRAACDEAHRLGYKVAAHVESPEGIVVALQNGVDTIEHGAMPSEEILKLFKEKGAALIATISPAIPYAVFDRDDSNCTEEAQINSKVLLEGMVKCICECLRLKIPVGAGTDSSCPFTTQYNFWREAVLLQKYCGISNAEALHMITLNNARIAGIDAITGSVEVGKSADLIVTGRNPLEDLHALRDVEMVISQGTVYEHPDVRKMPVVDRLLDRYIDALPYRNPSSDPKPVSD